MVEPPRTPMDNLLNVLSGFSVGHEKALKQSIYNAVALFLLCLVCIASYGLYIILYPFVKPLIWALLCGSVLFPFKLYITNTVQSWFSETDNSHEPLLMDVVMVPIRIMDRISEGIGTFLHGHIKYVGIIIGTCGVTTMIYWYTPSIVTCLTWWFIQLGVSFVSFFVTNCNVYMIWIIIIGYISILFLYWNPTTAVLFNYTSLVIWFIFSLYVSNVLGVYQVAVFIALQILCVAGFAHEVIIIMEDKENDGEPLTFSQAVQYALIGNELSQQIKNNLNNEIQENDDENNDERDNVFSDEILSQYADDIKEPTTWRDRKKISLKLGGKAMSLDTGVGQGQTMRTIGESGRTSSCPGSQVTIRDRYFLRKLRMDLRMSFDAPNDDVDTAKYMYGASYACAGMLMWKHKWILTILTIPIAWYIIKQLGIYFGLRHIIENKVKLLREFFEKWYNERHQAIIPAHVRGLYKIYIIVDRKMREILKGSVDAVATIAVILALLIFTFCASIFITIQIYAEGMHLVQVTGEILNSTLVNNPNIDWVPEQWEDSVNSVLDNAYTYGRSAISDGVKKLVKDFEPAKAELIEKKVVELWDRLYQAWMMSNDAPDMIGPTVDGTVVWSVWESIKESFVKMPTQMFNMTGIQNFAKENIGMLMSVLDSIWSIIKGNMSIVLSILTELLYIVLMSGSALLNFTLSTVVFFTTLFYLLSSSGKTYKPIELISMFSPMTLYSSDNMGGFAMALQEAVIGVFTATFKLASFFGMWTWFIHNLFQVKIVYLPSAFATVLAAVPFLDAYFACIPATIELWFTRSPFIAILFFTFHFLPCNIVITDFYKEIKGGGHPYLTGLSIAGGIFCLGVEGAIFGPLLLCCIIVAINLSRRYVHSFTQETLDSLKSQINQLEAD